MFCSYYFNNSNEFFLNASDLIFKENVTFDNKIDSNKLLEAHLYWTVLIAIDSKMFLQ